MQEKIKTIKNIHVLPTDNSSRLSIKDGVLILHRQQWRKGTQHIYITSDEEIEEDWFIDNNNSLRKSYKLSHVQFANPKKIILTTDQDLIKDSVQAIDDEFLEWFVKHSSCEEVEVIKYEDNNSPMLVKDKTYYYKIFIPKEEPCEHFTPTIGCIKDVCSCNKELTYTEAEEKEERIFNSNISKQETLEEFINSQPYYGSCTTEYLEGIEEGAKWQQEKMYSVEDLKEAYLTDCYDWICFEEWLEQFKKK